MTFNELKKDYEEVRKMIKSINPDSAKLNALKKKFLEELDSFLMNDSDYGNRKITEEKLKQIKNFMYEYSNDNYYFENGFYNTMGTYSAIIKLIIN